MKRKFTKKMIGTLLGLILLMTPLTASAETGTLQSLQQKKRKIVTQATQVKDEIASNKEKIHTTTGKITQIQIKIGQTNEKLKTLQNEIDTTSRRIQKRQDILAKQVKATYVNSSNLEFFNLLLSSKDFGDFISRAYAVYRITNQQQALINQQKSDEEGLVKAKEQLKVKTDQNKLALTQLNQLASDLQKTLKKNQQKLAGLQTQQATIRSKISSLSQKAIIISNPTFSESPNVMLPVDAAKGSIATLIQHAKKWIGHSTYVFGGGRTSYDQAHGRFDCSSFVHWAYESIGLDLSGWTTSELQYVGTRVSPDHMKPGDLVFFDTYKENGHVDIYLGNNLFIGSQSSTGVSIQSFDSTYWSRHFSGVVRRIVD